MIQPMEEETTAALREILGDRAASEGIAAAYLFGAAEIRVRLAAAGGDGE
jgi:hypothetical protein